MTVEVRVLHTGDEPQAAALLAAHADSSLFLRRTLAATGVLDHGARNQGPWAGAFEAGRLLAVASHTRFGTVTMQAPVHAGAVARAAVMASGRPIGGFIGPRAQTLAARVAFGLEGAPMRVESHEGLYALPLDALVVPVPLANGAWRCRRARPEDTDHLVEWRVRYLVETDGREDDAETRASSREDVERGFAEHAGWVLEADGAPVAYQQFNAMLPDVVQVGGVWTPPPLRGRGYGRAVVAGALLAMRAEGVTRGVLFTGDANVAARRAYAALGFERVGDWGLLFLKTPAITR
jgi:predicted GNAT family acetyltransferase